MELGKRIPYPQKIPLCRLTVNPAAASSGLALRSEIARQIGSTPASQLSVS
jgi:hypothetical protein